MAQPSPAAAVAPNRPHTPTQQALREVDVLIRSRYPLIYLITHEEKRLETMIEDLALKQNKSFYTWTATSGLTLMSRGQNSIRTVNPAHESLVEPAEIIRHIRDSPDAGIYLLKDFHPFLEDPHVVRRLRDVAESLKDSYKNILFCSPILNLPAELEKEVNIIDIPLPDITELFDLLKEVCHGLAEKDQSAVQLTQQDAQLMARAAAGLTLSEAENVFSKAIVFDAQIDKRDINLVLKEKQQIIRKSGILDFYPNEQNMGDVGGLQNLKQWLQMRSKAFGSSAAQYGLPSPKGILLLGAPGTGKSLTAKAVANTWQLPLLRMDFGRIFSGLVGSSEENMRRALKVAEGVSPAVLWIDEIEKALAGGTSGNSDGGTAARVFGTFLTWMQEKQAKVFVVATANRIENLPPELLRQGRFDAIFFIDLPTVAAREEIFRIQLQRRKRDPKKFDLKSLAQYTEGYSGAEIEHSITEALYIGFSQNRDLLQEDILKAIKETIPLSVTYAEELKRIREWAKHRARPAENFAKGDK